MKVFISWSGERSRLVAAALKEWLPDVLQGVEAWFSQEDVGKGTRSIEEITQALADASAGIVCITPENATYAPWLLFEAGALSKAVPNAKPFVCTYLFGLTYTDIPAGPLVWFQHTLATKDDTFRLLRTLNRARDAEQLDDQRIDRVFQRSWPDLERALQAIPPAASAPVPKRSVEEMVEELLSLMRDVASGIQTIDSRKDTDDFLRASLARYMYTPQQQHDQILNLVERLQHNPRLRSIPKPIVKPPTTDDVDPGKKK